MTKTDPKKAITVASASALAASLSTSLTAISMPEIARDLGATPREASWVLSAYLLTVSCLIPLAGQAADVVGRRRLLVTGLLLFVAGAAMCGSATALEMLIGARVFQGFGAAAMMAVGPSIVTSTVPPARRARSLSVVIAVTYIGLSIGPTLGGVIAGALGWNAVFFVVALGGAVSGALALAWLEHDQERGGIEAARKLDFRGAALFASALGALLVGARRGPEEGWTSRPVLALAGFAALALFAFVRNEATHRSPVMPLDLLSAPGIGRKVVSASLLYVVTFMLAFLIPFHLQRTVGMSPAGAGLFMTAQPVGMALAAPLGGWAGDRFGPRLPSATGMLLIAGGVFMLRAPGSNNTSTAVALGLVGIGAGLFVAPNSAAIMGAASRDRQSTAGALASTARNVGMTVGIAMAASLEGVLGYRGTLLVAAAVALANAVLAAIRG